MHNSIRIKPRTLLSVLALAVALCHAAPASAQFEQIQPVPGLPDYVAATSAGGHPIQFPNGDIQIIYKIQTDYSVNDYGPDHLYFIRSTDGGATWSEPILLDSSTDHQGICCISTAIGDNGRGLLSYYNNGSWRLKYSDNNGVNWTTSATPPNLGDGQTDIAAAEEGAFVSVYTVYGNTSNDLRVRTSADGITWSSPHVALPEDGTSYCGGTIAATGPEELIVIYEECWFGRGDQRPILKVTSSDNGATWSAPSEVVTSGTNFGRRADIVKDQSGKLWMLYTNTEDLYYTSSTDDGATWAPAVQWTDNTGSGPRPGDYDQDFSHNIAIVDGQPFAVFWARRDYNWFHLYYGIPGVSADPLITAVEQIPGEIPESIELQQNYPNPFNPSTRIEFSVPRMSPVRLQVFNMLGEEVARLADGVYQAGSYSVSWDAANLPSGTYFYRLQTTTATQTRKMLLVK